MFDLKKIFYLELLFEIYQRKALEWCFGTLKNRFIQNFQPQFSLNLSLRLESLKQKMDKINFSIFVKK